MLFRQISTSLSDRWLQDATSIPVGNWLLQDGGHVIFEAIFSCEGRSPAWQLTLQEVIYPPAPKVLGRDLPDGTRKRLQVYLGGGGPIFRPKPPVFDRSWRSPSKNTVKNSTEDTCSWTRPSKIGKRKVKKNRVFQLFDLNFLVCNIFFCGSAGGRARRRIFEFLDPFSDWFSSFCDSRNTGFYSVFLFSACLTASFKTSKNLVNYAVLCYGVNENIVNTSVFWRWLKKHCKLQCFWPPDPQKPWYLQWFLLLTAQKHCK